MIGLDRATDDRPSAPPPPPDGWSATRGDRLACVAWSRHGAARCETIVADVLGVYYVDCFDGGPPICLSAHSLDQYLRLERSLDDVAEEICAAWGWVLTLRARREGAREVRL